MNKAESVTTDHNGIAAEVLATWDRREQMGSLSQRETGLDLRSAYQVAAAVRRLREARGERVVGRKIGFTNTTIWAEYGVGAPIWGYVYDRTLHKLEEIGGRFDLSSLVEPRIEPEIMFGLSRAPEPGMDEWALLSCIDWVAQGFEIVQSLFPGWRFTAADTVAAFGLHGALLVGTQVLVRAQNARELHDALGGFEITLRREGDVADHGLASNVLAGGPLAALRHLVEVLAADPTAPALQAGEIISTGTVTRALPIASGESWSTSLTGIPLAGASIRFS